MDIETVARTALATRMPDAAAAGNTQDRYRNRLFRELEYIHNAGLASYIAAVTELVDQARTQGILVGPGRGSSPSSLVLYLLGITQVDPIANGLIVERWFSNPVIEIDVEWHRRKELIDHLWHRYGQEGTAYISTYRQDKATGKILLRGIHAACFAVSSQPIADIFPTWTAEDGRLVIDAERAAVEEQGVGVLTILGMKELSVIAEASKAIAARDPGFDRRGISEEDTTAMELFRAGATDDIFLFGSNGIRDLLTLAKPETSNDLFCLNAAYRPTFIKDGTVAELARRMSARSSSAPPNDDRFPEAGIVDINPVGELLRGSFGLLLFQEQFIEIVHRLTGWSYLESELYRRRAKKNAGLPEFQDELLGRVRDRFTIDANQEESLRQVIERSRHLYLRAHADSYQQIAWEMASLKARYPQEFSEAVGRVFGLRP